MASELRRLWPLLFLALPAKTAGQHAAPFVPQWQKGMTYSRAKGGDLGDTRSTDALYYLKRNIGVEWIALHPGGYQPTWNMPFVTKDDDPPDGQLRQAIRRARQLGLKVMVKPHVHLTKRENGAWRGQIAMADEESWQLWFAAYQRFVLHYARLAAEEQVDLFCVGTELTAAALQRPEDWRRLITQVKQHYPGPLVYAAHWENFDRIDFWDALDYIGINAYFPLSGDAPPTAAALKRRADHLADYIALLHQRTGKPVLLTEVGFKSVQGSSRAPWQWHSGREPRPDQGEQALCYQAILEAFCPRPWFFGMYWWRWYSDLAIGGSRHTGFTPHGKEAETTLSHWYKQRLPKLLNNR